MPFWQALGGESPCQRRTRLRLAARMGFCGLSPHRAWIVPDRAGAIRGFLPRTFQSTLKSPPPRPRLPTPVALPVALNPERPCPRFSPEYRRPLFQTPPAPSPGRHFFPAPDPDRSAHGLRQNRDRARRPGQARDPAGLDLGDGQQRGRVLARFLPGPETGAFRRPKTRWNPCCAWGLRATPGAWPRPRKKHTAGFLRHIRENTGCVFSTIPCAIPRGFPPQRSHYCPPW